MSWLRAGRVLVLAPDAPHSRATSPWSHFGRFSHVPGGTPRLPPWNLAPAAWPGGLGTLRGWARECTGGPPGARGHRHSPTDPAVSDKGASSGWRPGRLRGEAGCWAEPQRAETRTPGQGGRDPLGTPLVCGAHGTGGWLPHLQEALCTSSGAGWAWGGPARPRGTQPGWGHVVPRVEAGGGLDRRGCPDGRAGAGAGPGARGWRRRAQRALVAASSPLSRPGKTYCLGSHVVSGQRACSPVSPFPEDSPSHLPLPSPPPTSLSCRGRTVVLPARVPTGARLSGGPAPTAGASGPSPAALSLPGPHPGVLPCPVPPRPHGCPHRAQIRQTGWSPLHTCTVILPSA